jgi:hypothetical protein
MKSACTTAERLRVLCLLLPCMTAAGAAGTPKVSSEAGQPASLSPWQATQLVESSPGNAVQPRMATYGNGDAIAVWAQHDGVRYSIWSNRYTAANGWGTAELIEQQNSGDASNPQVAVDPAGHAIAVWQQSDGVRHNIWSNRYTPGNGWGRVELIESGDEGSASDPQIAVDAAGNALAVWAQFDGEGSNIHANRYSADAGWGSDEIIETQPGKASRPQIAVDAQGNAVAVWSQSFGSIGDIRSNRYLAGEGWGTSEPVEAGTGSAGGVQIAMDERGNAIAVWQQLTGSRYDIRSNRYRSDGSGWSNDVLVENVNTGAAVNPQLAVEKGGTAFVVWQQTAGLRTDISSSRYTSVGGWEAATLVSTENVGQAADPQVAVDGNGTAFAVWRQPGGGRQNVWSNRYTNGCGWSTAVPAELIDTGDASAPQVALDASGDARAIWVQLDGTRSDIVSSRHLMNASAAWGVASLIEHDDTGRAADPRVALNSSGEGMVVWQQSDGTRFNIWARRRRACGGWDAPALLESAAGSATNPQVAIDSAGNAIAVWQQNPNGSNGLRVWSNRYTAGLGWGTAQMLSNNNEAEYPQIALDRSGNAFAVWAEWGLSTSGLWARRYSAATGWETAVRIGIPMGASPIMPQVAFDPLGNAMAVWNDLGSLDVQRIWASRYVPGLGWSTQRRIDRDGIGAAMRAEVALDANGNAIVAWIQADGPLQSDGTHWHVWANRYEPALGWGVAVQLEPFSGHSSRPDIAMSANGNAIVFWVQPSGMGSTIWANSFVPGGSWSGAFPIETTTPFASSPDVGMDFAGNMLVVWKEVSEDTSSVFAKRYTHDSGWGDPQLIDSDLPNAFAVRIAVNAAGQALAVWEQANDLSNTVPPFTSIHVNSFE